MKQTLTPLQIRKRLDTVAERQNQLYTSQQMANMLSQIFEMKFTTNSYSYTRISKLVTLGIIHKTNFKNIDAMYSFKTVLSPQDRTMAVVKYLKWRENQLTTIHKPVKIVDVKPSVWSRLKSIIFKNS